MEQRRRLPKSIRALQISSEERSSERSPRVDILLMRVDCLDALHAKSAKQEEPIGIGLVGEMARGKVEGERAVTSCAD